MQFTDSERKLFAILKKHVGTPMLSTDIARRAYRRSERPRYAQNAVVTTLTSLAKKIARSREPYRIVRGPRAGPHPVKFTLRMK